MNIKYEKVIEKEFQLNYGDVVVARDSVDGEENVYFMFAEDSVSNELTECAFVRLGTFVGIQEFTSQRTYKIGDIICTYYQIIDLIRKDKLELIIR